MTLSQGDVGVLASMRRLWKAIPAPAGLRSLASSRLYEASLGVGRALRRAPAQSSLRPGPLIVSGFYDGVAGVSRGVAATADALETAGLPVIRHDIGPVIARPSYEPATLPAGPGGVWIQHCNAPEADRLFSHVRRKEIAGRYRIAYWVWELPHAPTAWRAAAKAFHEIWVPSAFVAEGFRNVGVPVRVMPHPLRIHAKTAPDRRRFNMPEGAVIFGVYADARSSLARKNPLGAIEAFRRAFPQAEGRAFLSIKLVAPEADPRGVAALRSATEGRPDIRIWSDRLSEEAMAVYLASLDAVLSLHRSEGFGLVLAEALLAGKPLVATAWSGSQDVTVGQPGFHPVAARLVPVVDPSATYRGGAWAEPDLDEAARILRQVVAKGPGRTSTPDASLEDRLRRPWRPDALAAAPWRPLVAASPAA